MVSQVRDHTAMSAFILGPFLMAGSQFETCHCRGLEPMIPSKGTAGKAESYILIYKQKAEKETLGKALDF